LFSQNKTKNMFQVKLLDFPKNKINPKKLSRLNINCLQKNTSKDRLNLISQTIRIQNHRHSLPSRPPKDDSSQDEQIKREIRYLY